MWWGRLVLMGAAANGIGAATAQTTPQPSQARETVVVHGASSCSAEQTDGSRALSFDCLNAQLAEGDLLHVPDLKAVDAAGRGNPERLGTFSYTATQIRMGGNFGKSAKPERPPAPTYTNALLPGGK